MNFPILGTLELRLSVVTLWFVVVLVAKIPKNKRIPQSAVVRCKNSFTGGPHFLQVCSNSYPSFSSSCTPLTIHYCLPPNVTLDHYQLAQWEFLLGGFIAKEAAVEGCIKGGWNIATIFLLCKLFNSELFQW